MNKNNTPIPYLEVQDKVATIRKQPVMADADVAELYGVETREVNQAVRNNPDKFPEDYMFALSDSELKDLRSKILITNVSIGQKWMEACGGEFNVNINGDVFEVFIRFSLLT